VELVKDLAEIREKCKKKWKKNKKYQKFIHKITEEMFSEENDKSFGESLDRQMRDSKERFGPIVESAI
jgi:translation initiation factor 2 alpha subunit (eIF-2alpha)